jgi:hypothetical protein
MLITTRLDNDDALAVRFCERLRQAKLARQRCWLNFDNGLQLDSNWIYHYTNRSGPFISFAADCRVSRTVFCVGHHRAAQVAPVCALGDGPWWLQVIHGMNLCNRLSRSARLIHIDEWVNISEAFCDDVKQYVRVRIRMG